MYNPRTRSVFVTKLCLSRGLELFTLLFFFRSKSALSARSSDEGHETTATQCSNIFTRALPRAFLVVTGYRLENFVKAAQIICLPAAELFCHFFCHTGLFLGVRTICQMWGLKSQEKRSPLYIVLDRLVPGVMLHSYYSRSHPQIVYLNTYQLV